MGAQIDRGTSLRDKKSPSIRRARELGVFRAYPRHERGCLLGREQQHLRSSGRRDSVAARSPTVQHVYQDWV